MRKTKENAITMIALIITIIVLLILAGVSFVFVFGKNGIINKAILAKEENEKNQALEELRVKMLEIQTDKQGNATLQDVIQAFNDDEKNEYIVSLATIATIKGDIPDATNKNEIYVIYKKYQFKIDKNLIVTIVGEGNIEDDDKGEQKEELDYVKTGLKVWYDGINNTGTGSTDSNSTTWKDLVGNNDGTLLNFDKSNESGWKNNGLLFDGTNDKVQFKGDITDEYTMSFLIQPTVYKNDWPRIIAENPFPTIHLQSTYSYRVALYGQGKDAPFPNTTQLPTTQKTMITVTYDGSEVKLYENDKYISSFSTTTKPTSVANAYLGGRNDDSRQYTGYIYNCMIYDRVLYFGEICNNYQKNIERYNIEENNSIYIELNDDTNTDKKLINIINPNKNKDVNIEYKLGENNDNWIKYENKFEYTNQKVYARLKDKDGNILDTKEAEFGELEVKSTTDTSILVKAPIEKMDTFSYADLYINNDLKEKNITGKSELEVKDLQSNKEYDINLKIHYWTGNVLSLNCKANTVNSNEYNKTGLVLWYDGINNIGTGNTDSNSTTWKDLVGNNDGTLLNFDNTDESGWKNNGLLFDGTNDKVQFKGDITDEYTMSFLIQPTVYKNDWPRIIAENPFPTIHLQSTYSYRVALYGQGKDAPFPNTTQLPTTQKTMITVTYDGSEVKLYENDKYISSFSTTTKPTSIANAYLGGRSDNSRQYTGYIYNCMIYNKVLNQDVISYNYNINTNRYN